MFAFTPALWGCDMLKWPLPAYWHHSATYQMVQKLLSPSKYLVDYFLSSSDLQLCSGLPALPLRIGGWFFIPPALRWGCVSESWNGGYNLLCFGSDSLRLLGKLFIKTTIIISPCHREKTPTIVCLNNCRVQPGHCYHLYNGLRASLLDDYQLPEILRTPLEELCLQIKVNINLQTFVACFSIGIRGWEIKLMQVWA